MNYFIQFLIALITIGTAPIAFAHELQISSGISAIMHVHPNDNPVMDEPADFYFTFKDQSGKFAVANCNCTAQVKNNDVTVFEGTIYGGSINTDNAAFSVVFPKAGVYVITLKGEPKQSGQFEPFTLSYDMRVDAINHSLKHHDGKLNGEHLGHIIIFGGGFLVLLGIQAKYYYNKRKQKPETK